MIKRTYKGVEYIMVRDTHVNEVRAAMNSAEGNHICEFCSLGQPLNHTKFTTCPAYLSTHSMHCEGKDGGGVWMTEVDFMAFSLGEPTLYE